MLCHIVKEKEIKNWTKLIKINTFKEKYKMMRDIEKTIGNLTDKQSTAYISSVDSDGFPNTKACLSLEKEKV